MPEPVLIILGVGAAIAWMKGGQPSAPSPTGAPSTVVSNPPAAQLAEAPAATTASNQPISTAGAGTGPDAPLATTASVLSPVPISEVLATPPPPTDTMAVPPADLVAALDNDAALKMRAYAAMYPDDFRAFLDRYADRVVLRNDLMFEALTNPPEAGYELTPQMGLSLGTSAYKVAQALNGVAAGKSVDVFGVAASAAGQIPGINPDVVSGLQALALGYRALTSINQVLSLAAANNVGVMNIMSLSGVSGAYPGLSALPLGGVLMAVGLVVDIGFTIIGDKPDLQKAVDVALDVASLACLFIPVIGWVVAIVIQLVKFIIDLFGEDLFGGGMTKEQKEMIEAAKYGEKLNPMYPELAAAYTPRELWRTIVDWGSGYCGGKHVVAMGINLKLKVGDTLMVGGQPFTVPSNPEVESYYGDGTALLLGFGDNDQPGGCYWIRSTPLALITNDEQAWALAVYANVNGVIAGAQVGVRESMQTQFEAPAEQLIKARTVPMQEFIVKHKLTLNQIDQIALEYRAKPHLAELAKSFGWLSWQEMFASTVADEWLEFSSSITNGSLSDFAKQYGFPTMYKFREAALTPFEDLWSAVTVAIAGLRSRKAMWESYAQQQYEQQLWQQMSSSAP